MCCSKTSLRRMPIGRFLPVGTVRGVGTAFEPLFAQFGFLKRLAELGITENSLPLIMGAMAAGGIGMSLIAPRSRLWACPSCRLQTGLVGCALTTVWSLLPLNAFTAAVVALMIGLSLGLLPVTLVANLPLWIGIHRPLLKVGLGTGIGYFLCNYPPLFTASPRWIALASAASGGADRSGVLLHHRADEGVCG